MSEDIYHGKWDYRCACDPREKYVTWKTFSIGIFQWQSKASGKGFKKGPASYRIKSNVKDAEDAFERAEAFCENKNGTSK